MIYVVATNEVKPECREEFIRITEANIPAVLAENGCIFYRLNEDAACDFCPANANTLTFVECWESLDALKAHLAAPHMAVYMEKVKDMRISSSLKVLNPVC